MYIVCALGICKTFMLVKFNISIIQLLFRIRNFRLNIKKLSYIIHTGCDFFIFSIFFFMFWTALECAYWSLLDACVWLEAWIECLKPIGLNIALHTNLQLMTKVFKNIYFTLFFIIIKKNLHIFVHTSSTTFTIQSIIFVKHIFLETLYKGDARVKKDKIR